MKKYLMVSLVTLLLTNSIFAQQKITLNLYNGSVVHGEPLFKSVKINVKYGKIDIPLSDIVRIDVGFHCEAELQDKIEKSIKELGSAVHLNRVAADKFLREEYVFSYGFLKTYKNSDREVSKRVEEIVNFIKKEKQSYLYDRLDEDAVYLESGSVFKGKIEGLGKLQLNTECFGKIGASLSGIRSMYVVQNRKVEVVLNGIDGQWHSSKVMVSGKFFIKAFGAIDLYPNDPEKYTASPNGSTVNSPNNGQFAGTLMIRYNGNIVKCGNEFSGEVTSPTLLEFYITPTGWNHPDYLPPTGKYHIEITR